MSSRKPKDKFYANEEFLKKAKAEGRVRRVRLPIVGLKVDYKHYQPRVVHLDMDHVRDLSRIVMDDDADGNPTELEPIVVFEFENGSRVPVDGHHRIGAYKKAGRDMIPCDVIAGGTKQEAVEFAAACNQRAMLPRSKDDVKKAVFMLLGNGWLERSASSIARQTGVGVGTVVRYRSEYCDKAGVPPPVAVENKDGRVQRLSLNDGIPRLIERKPCRPGRQIAYQARFNGKTIHLGIDKKVAESRLKELTQGAARHAVDLSSFSKTCAHRGVSVSGSGDAHIGGYITHLAAVATFNGASCEALLATIARVLILSSKLGKPKAVVVRSANTTARQSSIESAAESVNVEFMTLDEFVAAVKADEAEQAEGLAS